MKLPIANNPQTDRRNRTFDRLFDHYGPRVMGYLVRLTGDRAEAEDLTQETFLAAFQGQHMFQGRSSPLTWLLGIARRRHYDRSKRSVLRQEPLDEATVGEGDPAERVALAATLAAALERLNEPERDVLLLTAVQGLTLREVAELLGEPLGTIKWRAHEATKQLRAILNAADERYEARYGKTGERAQRTDNPNTTRFAAHPDR